MGSTQDHFFDFRVSLLGSQKYFREYLRENKNILGYYSGAYVLLIHAKKPELKNLMLVPLKWHKKTFVETVPVRYPSHVSQRRYVCRYCSKLYKMKSPDFPRKMLLVLSLSDIFLDNGTSRCPTQHHRFRFVFFIFTISNIVRIIVQILFAISLNRKEIPDTDF